MDDDTPPTRRGNVLPFQPAERKKNSGACAATTADRPDNGPSPEESLRMMRAFLGIKNRKSRQDLIDLIEGVSQARVPAPEPANK
jgi:hypothetical protein